MKDFCFNRPHDFDKTFAEAQAILRDHLKLQIEQLNKKQP